VPRTRILHFSTMEIDKCALECLDHVSEEMGGLVASKIVRLRSYWRFLDDVGKKIIILHYASRNLTTFRDIFPNATESMRLPLKTHTEKHLDSLVSDGEFVSLFDDLFSQG